VTVGRIAQPQDLLKEMEAVTARQIQQTARLLFETPKLFLAVIGPVPEQQVAALRELCVL